MDPSDSSADRPPRRPLSTRRKLLYIALALALALLLAELLLRLLDPEIFHFVIQARQVHQYTTWSEVDLRPDSSADLYLSGEDGLALLDFHLRTNALGIRCRDPLQPVESCWNGRKRVVVHCLGDSMTMGWGVEAEDSYPEQLGRLLGPSYLVLNLGVDGYGLAAACEKSRRVGGQFPPDVVLYEFFPNDFEEDERAAALQERSALRHGLSRAYDGLRRHSYLMNLPFVLRWARSLRARLDQPALHPEGRGGAETAKSEREQDAGDVPDNETTRALLDLACLCRAERRVLAVLVVHKCPESLQMLRFCEQHGIRCLDCALGNELRIRNDVHFSAAGNRVLAGRVRNELFPSQ